MKKTAQVNTVSKKKNIWKFAIQSDLERLTKWARVNLMWLNKVKCKVLHQGQGNPWYQYRQRGECIENSPMEKALA